METQSSYTSHCNIQNQSITYLISIARKNLTDKWVSNCSKCLYCFYSQVPVCPIILSSF